MERQGDTSIPLSWWSIYSIWVATTSEQYDFKAGWEMYVLTSFCRLSICVCIMCVRACVCVFFSQRRVATTSDGRTSLLL